MKKTRTTFANSLLRAMLVIMSVIFIITSITVGFGSTAYGDTESIEEVITQTEFEAPEEPADIFKDGKIYCDATLEDDFANDSVIVILDEKLSRFAGVAQDIVTRLFSLLDYNNIESLTDIENPSDSLLNFYETHKFRQIINIELKIKSKQHVLNIIKLLEKIDGILYAGPDYCSSPAATVNDKYYYRQWNLSHETFCDIDIENAWDLVYNNNYFSDVRIGVIDSGIADHEDLSENVIEGYDFYNNNNTTNDDYSGHGTHVAGIIGAVTNNDLGVAGVAPNVNLVPLQTSHYDSKENEYVHNMSDVIEAITYATKRWGTDKQISVLNYSVSGFGKSIGMLSSISQFPGLFVWCAYNKGENVDTFPDISKFKLDNIISVGAIDGTGARAEFSKNESSNYGRNVDIFAPGSDITCTYPNSICQRGACGEEHVADGYHRMWGTSMAAPHVSGVAALILGMFPWLSAAQIKEAIVESAIPITIENIKTGRLSAYNALYYAHGYFSFAPQYLRYEIVGKSGTTWKVKIINKNYFDVEVTYNSKMCFKDDAIYYTGLKDLVDVTIRACDSVTVDISENYFAEYITAVIKSGTSGGRTYRRVSYAKELKQNGNSYSIEGVKNAEYCVTTKFFNAPSLDFDDLILQPTKRSGGFLWVYDWEIKITNPNWFRVRVAYNTKMCFKDDAANFNVGDVDHITIEPHSSSFVPIAGNGTACYITACIEYSYLGFDYRKITYANDLAKNSNNYSLTMYYNKMHVL